MASKRLYIGNLNYNTDDASLKAAFAAYGEVKDAKVVMDRETGRSRGFGFVEYFTDVEAAEAITQMNGADLDGRALRVNEAEERKGGGGGGGGFRGAGGPPRDGGGGGGYGGGGGGGSGRGGGRGGGSKRKGRDDDRW